MSAYPYPGTVHGVGEGLRFVALGDSVTVGLGDPAGDRWRGWAHLLAESLATAYPVTFTNLAGIGATADQVRREQLPEAIRLRPQLASLVVGVNDTMRSTFDPGRIREDLCTVADQLASNGARLLMVRFHDHGRVFRLPSPLRAALWRRIAELNAIYDEIHRTYGGICLDLSSNTEVYTRSAWSIDRLHPSERGHRWLAKAFAERLEVADLSVLENAAGAVPTKWQELHWLVSRGVPWAFRRIRDLGPWTVRLAVAELTGALSRSGAETADGSGCRTGTAVDARLPR